MLSYMCSCTNVTLFRCFQCSEEHAAEVAHARYEKKKLDEHRSRAGRTIQLPIVLSDEGGKDEDDTGRLSELIALAESVYKQCCLVV